MSETVKKKKSLIRASETCLDSDPGNYGEQDGKLERN